LDEKQKTKGECVDIIAVQMKSHQMSETMRLLTSVTILALPLTVLTGYFVSQPPQSLIECVGIDADILVGNELRNDVECTTEF
jgi:hypothetical protein